MLCAFLCFIDILEELYFPYFFFQTRMLQYLIQEDLFYVSFIMYLIFLVCHSLPLVLVGSRSIVQLKLLSKIV